MNLTPFGKRQPQGTPSSESRSESSDMGLTPREPDDEFSSIGTTLAVEVPLHGEIIPRPRVIPESLFNTVVSALREWGKELPIRDWRDRCGSASSGHHSANRGPIDLSSGEVRYVSHDVVSRFEVQLHNRSLFLSDDRLSKKVCLEIRPIIRGPEISPEERGVAVSVATAAGRWRKPSEIRRVFEGEDSVELATLYLEGLIKGMVGSTTGLGESKPNSINSVESVLNGVDVPPKAGRLRWEVQHFKTMTQNFPANNFNVTLPGKFNARGDNTLCQAKVSPGFIGRIFGGKESLISIRYNPPSLELGCGMPYSVELEKAGEKRVTREFNNSKVAFLFAAGLAEGAYHASRI